MVLLWPGVIASFASAYIMWRSIQHDDQFGPFSSQYGANKGEAASVEMAQGATVPVPAATNGSARPEPYAAT